MNALARNTQRDDIEMDGLEVVTRLGRRVSAGWLLRASGRRGASGGPRSGRVPVRIEIVGAAGQETLFGDDQHHADRPRSSER